MQYANTEINVRIGENECEKENERSRLRIRINYNCSTIGTLGIRTEYVGKYTAFSHYRTYAKHR